MSVKSGPGPQVPLISETYVERSVSFPRKALAPGSAGKHTMKADEGFVAGVVDGELEVDVIFVSIPGLVGGQDG